MKTPVDGWFGGGADLTPYYLWEADAEHFHKTIRAACDKHGEQLYPRFKKQCDDYFFNTHRGERRGVGGIFYDYLREDGEDRKSLEEWYNFSVDAGNSFLPAYLPIVEKRMEDRKSTRLNSSHVAI